MKNIWITRKILKSTAKLQGLLFPAILAPALVTSLVCARCSSSPQGGQTQEEAMDNSVATDAPAASKGQGGDAAAQGEGMNNAVAGTNNFGGANPSTTSQSNNLGVAASPTNPLTNGNLAPQNALLTNNIPLNAAPVNQGAPALTNAVPINGVTPGNLADPALPNAETANTAPTKPEAAPAADSTARAAASPFTNPHMNWPGKGKVKYATHQLTRHSSANGPVIGEFVQGDHPLVYQNGNWAELNDGSFVKGNGLSEKGVGYRKK
jgi:hypothetical protein